MELSKLVGVRTESFPCVLSSTSGENSSVKVFVIFVAVLCGGGIPPPVLSYYSLMVLRFTSDSSVARRGFRAAVTFISHAGAYSTFVKLELVNDSRTLKVTVGKYKFRSFAMAKPAVIS